MESAHGPGLPSSPPLSVVLATNEGWTAAQTCLASLLPQAAAVGAEVVVADGSAGAAGPPPSLPSNVRWLRSPGTGLFRLRRQALVAACAPIVAVTEDHCVVAPDWCERIIEAHARHPDADVIKGAVFNGSSDTPVERAAFWLGHWPNLPPFTGRASDAVLGVSCVSYKRRALELLRRDTELLPELVANGYWPNRRAALATARIHVTHCQAEAFWRTSALQFHNARALSAYRRGRWSARDWLRVTGALALPAARTARVVAACQRKQVPLAELCRCIPHFVWLFCCRGAGELAGYVFGPGDSERELR